MKFRLPSFPLVIAAILALAAWWLEYFVSGQQQANNANLRGDPDSIVDTALIDRFNAKGVLDMKLSASTIKHFPADDSAELTDPVVHIIGNQRNSVWQSKTANVSSGGNRVVLKGNVVGKRIASADEPAMQITTETLTLLTNEQIASTDAHVSLLRGNDRVDAVGMEWNNIDGHLILNHQVDATFRHGKD